MKWQIFTYPASLDLDMNLWPNPGQWDIRRNPLGTLRKTFLPYKKKKSLRRIHFSFLSLDMVVWGCDAVVIGQAVCTKSPNLTDCHRYNNLLLNSSLYEEKKCLFLRNVCYKNGRSQKHSNWCCWFQALLCWETCEILTSIYLFFSLLCFPQYWIHYQAPASGPCCCCCCCC